MAAASKSRGCGCAVVLCLGAFVAWFALGSHLGRVSREARSRATLLAKATTVDGAPLAGALDACSQALDRLLRVFSTRTAEDEKEEVDTLLAALRIPATEPARAASALQAFTRARGNTPFAEAAGRLAAARRNEAAALERDAFWERVAKAPTALDLRVLARLESDKDIPAVAKTHLATIRVTTDLFLQVPTPDYGSGIALAQDDWEKFALATGRVPTVREARLVLTAVAEESTLDKAFFGKDNDPSMMLERWAGSIDARMIEAGREVWSGHFEAEDPPLPSSLEVQGGLFDYHTTKKTLLAAAVARAGEHATAFAPLTLEVNDSREIETFDTVWKALLAE